MNIILLSGGSGKRLWPLSNDVRSKQFLKIFRKADGTKESMAMRMYRMIKEVEKDSTITIATSENQIPQIKAQLGENVGVSIEPTRRDTFPAIALATAFLKKKGVKNDEPVVVCPVDPYVEADYFECLKELSDAAGKDDAAKLTLMGIEPTYPRLFPLPRITYQQCQNLRKNQLKKWQRSILKLVRFGMEVYLLLSFRMSLVLQGTC